MITEKIFLKTLNDVKDFVSICMLKPYDIELLLGKYVVNAKSIMGVFSLDLTSPLTVVANTEDDLAFKNEVAPYIYVEEDKA
jgi:phosphotransferase system HPr-like phosphotransfer protein